MTYDEILRQLDDLNNVLRVKNSRNSGENKAICDAIVYLFGAEKALERAAVAGRRAELGQD